MEQLHSEMKLTLNVGKIVLADNGAPKAIEDVQFSIESSSDVPQALMQTVYGMMERALNRIVDAEEKKSEAQKGDPVSVRLIPPPVMAAVRS